MANLVENILSLESEANVILTQAQAEAKEMERLALAEAEAYRRKLGEETDQKVRAFQKEMEEKHQRSAAEVQKGLAQALDAIDHVEGAALKRQIDKIVTTFSEL